MGVPYVCIVKAGDVSGVMLLKDETGYNVHGFKSEAEGLRYFEDSYNRAHSRGYEASMSACINSITFQPSIVPLSLEEITANASEMKAVTVHNVSGRMTLLPLVAEAADRFWESGSKPRLIGA